VVEITAPKNMKGTTGSQRNISKFFCYRWLFEFQMFVPIWVIFLQEEHGLSLTQVTVVDLAFWLTVAVAEVPTGVIADTWGRKYSMAIAVVLMALGVGLFALAPTWPLFMLANMIWAVAFTCDSGAAIAFLYDSLRAADRTEEFIALRSRVQIVERLTFALGSVLGGIVATVSLKLPFLLYVALLLPAMALVWSFEEPPREPVGTGKTAGYWSIVGSAGHTIRTQPGLQYALLYSGLLPLAGYIVTIVFLQPHARALGLPLASMGLLIVDWQMTRVAGAAASPWLLARCGETLLLRLVPIPLVLGTLGLGLFHSLWGIALFGIVGFASAVATPVIENCILRQTPGSIRATIMSVDSLVFRAITAATEPGLGWLGDKYGLAATFLALGSGVGVSMLGVLTLWARRQR
jgi:hypothetical protein